MPVRYATDRTQDSRYAWTAVLSKARVLAWGILGWSVLAGMVAAGWLLALHFGLRAFDALWPASHDGTHLLLPKISGHLFFFSVIFLLYRLGRLPVALGLIWPHGRDVALGLACTATYQAAFYGLLIMWGHKFSTGVPTSLPIVLLFGMLIVVLAPLTEEILYRGMLYGKLVQSRLGVVGAILISSLAFSLIHLDSPWVSWTAVFYAFLNGVLWGWLRWRSGSTLLTFLLHAQWNLTAVAVEPLLQFG